MNTIYFLLKCWWQCARSVFVTRMNHKSAQSAAGLKKCKQSQPPLLRPFSLPHIIRLYPCLSLLHCHLSYNLKGSQMPSRPPPPHHVEWVSGNSLWQKCRLNLRNLNLKKDPGAFLKKTKTKKQRTGNDVRLAASSAVTSHPQSMLCKGIIQSDTAVCVYCGMMQSVICYLVHNILCFVWFSSALDPSEKHTCRSLHSPLLWCAWT